MKKTILSLAAMALSGVLFAQTHSDLAENAPTASGEGYTFNFKGTSGNNCAGGGGVQNWAQTTQVWTLDGSDSLVVTIPSSSTYEGNMQIAQIYTGDCAASTIDLSSTTNQKIAISLKSPEAGQLVVIMLDGTNNNFSGTPNEFALVAGVNTLNASTINFGSVNSSAVSAIGLLFRGPTGYNDASFDGVVKVDFIKLGDAITSTSVQSTINNSLVSVYPNPAKDQVNIDLSSLNSNDASIKIINANGTTVYEAKATSENELINTSSLLQGMYMVQITSGNSISNKKLVIN